MSGRWGGEAAASRPWLGAALVLAASILWATLGIFAKRLYAVGLTPLELASVRASVALCGLALWMLARPRRLRLPAADLLFFALFGLISIALFQYLYFAALERTTVSVAAALLYTAPAFVVLLSRLTAGEQVRRPQLVALGLVLGGVFLVTGALRGLASGEAAITAPALGLGLASGLTYGLYTIFGKRALARYDAVQTVFFAFLFGALFLALAAPPWRPLIAHSEVLPALLGIGILPTLAAYLLYIGGLRHLPSGTASMLASAEPVVAAWLGFSLLGETMRWDQGLGMGAIVAAALVLARSAGPPAPATAPVLRATDPPSRPAPR